MSSDFLKPDDSRLKIAQQVQKRRSAVLQPVVFVQPLLLAEVLLLLFLLLFLLLLLLLFVFFFSSAAAAVASSSSSSSSSALSNLFNSKLVLLISNMSLFSIQLKVIT